jgi:ACS family tartrate transporter-like MFS transporter
VVGLWGAGALGTTTASLVLLCVGTIGINGSNPPFWPLPSAYLTGPAAAAGIALVNSVGNLGGLVGPLILGIGKKWTGGFAAGLYGLGCLGVMGAIVTLIAIKSQPGAAAAQTPEKKKETVPAN